MISFNENETLQEDNEEEYDYTNEEPIEELDYDEEEIDYCD
jgi:hypothetical protein